MRLRAWHGPRHLSSSVSNASITFNMGRLERALQPHMHSALQQISKRLTGTDVLIEVRDARLPFSDNGLLEAGASLKHHRRLLLLHKADLSNASVSLRQVR
jgi:ribosome biogenesis GTPase A